METTTRSAIVEDLPILLQFEQGIIEAERPFDPTLKKGNINYYDIRELIESPDAEVVVVEDQEILGSGYIQIQDSKPYKKHSRHGYIGFMFIKPDHRGKGIVQLVTNDLLDWARSRGVSEVKLEVYDKNESAVRAYEKAGFSKNLVEMRLEL
ncbi:MAG: GNAT family N-acetyltransferase [Cyclobacteriaceae bacterium]